MDSKETLVYSLAKDFSICRVKGFRQGSLSLHLKKITPLRYTAVKDTKSQEE